MNYYIQGDADNADKIRSAFEKLGYEKVNAIHIGDYANERLFFFTENGKVRSTLKDCGIVHIIKTHPDYKELELPVQPKFKDGDVLVTTKIRSCPFIYRKPDFNNDLAYYYVGIDGNGDLSIGWPKRTLCHFGLIADAVIAGQGQRNLLFKKIKEAGYEWDADKKELKKIPKHYDIANFHAGMPVLVRADNDCSWDYSVFSRITGNEYWHFSVCNGVSFTQCIPLNDDTKHLLGTTDMPDEMYINW